MPVSCTVLSGKKPGSSAAHLISSGTRWLRCSYAWSRVELAGTQPSALEIRHTCAPSHMPID